MLKTFNTIWKNAPFNKVGLGQRPYTTSKQVSTHLELRPTRLLYNCASSPCDTGFKKRFISKGTTSNSLSRSKNIAKKYKEMEANLKWRTDPVITTLDTPQFKSILRKNILDLVALFLKYNYEIRIAGGAVRLVNFFWLFPFL